MRIGIRRFVGSGNVATSTKDKYPWIVDEEGKILTWDNTSVPEKYCKDQGWTNYIIEPLVGDDLSNQSPQ
jgi:hypothetical protein